MLEARGRFRSAICFRSILSRQNGLNRNMEQQKEKLAENPVFLFFRPIGPLMGSLGCKGDPNLKGWQLQTQGSFLIDFEAPSS